MRKSTDTRRKNKSLNKNNDSVLVGKERSKSQTSPSYKKHDISTAKKSQGTKRKLQKSDDSVEIKPKVKKIKATSKQTVTKNDLSKTKKPNKSKGNISSMLVTEKKTKTVKLPKSIPYSPNKSSRKKEIQGIPVPRKNNNSPMKTVTKKLKKNKSRSEKQMVQKKSKIKSIKSENKLTSKIPVREMKNKTVKLEKDSSPIHLGSSKYAGKKYVGAHVSISGGLHNAITNAMSIGAKAFGLFLRSQRQWVSKPLTIETAKLFREACEKHNFSSHLILPHGSYLLNCGSPCQETLDKSRAALIDELKRCEMLGITMFNFHPGSTCGVIPVEKCLDNIGESINLAHKETNSVITVIENMSKQGNTVGGDFKELHGIIDRVKDKSRIGVCLDTCHAYAAGYDISTEEGFNQMMNDFESIVGIEYLKAVHLNDSVGKLGCHLDRHENIGRGYIGLTGFKHVMNDPRFNDIPMILETPANVDDSDEIKILYNLCE